MVRLVNLPNFTLSNTTNMNTIHYRLTLNLLTGCLLEEWTVDFGNGPIWESSSMPFPTQPKNAAELHERHMCISHYMARKCTDSRDQYIIIR